MGYSRRPPAAEERPHAGFVPARKEQRMFGQLRRRQAIDRQRLHAESRPAAVAFVERLAQPWTDGLQISRARLTRAATARQSKHSIRVDPA